MKLSGRLSQRWPALLALGLPVSVGTGWMAASGAPQRYLAINVASLLAAAVMLMTARLPHGPRQRRMLAFALLTLCFLPQLTGPWVNGIARWIPAGPLALHTGAFAFPAIAVLAAHDEDYAAPILLAALLAASIMPDGAFGFAVVFAAIALHDRTRDWRTGLVGVVGFFAAIVMVLEGELPPQPFVERVIADAVLTQPLAAAGLLISMAGAVLLILFAAPMPAPARFALAGSLFGFALLSLVSHYPGVLIGYGAAPILGYGLALGLIAAPSERRNPE